MEGAEVHGLLSFERWRGVVGELLLLFGGALDADVAEEEDGAMVVWWMAPRELAT